MSGSHGKWPTWGANPVVKFPISAAQTITKMRSGAKGRTRTTIKRRQMLKPAGRGGLLSPKRLGEEIQGKSYEEDVPVPVKGQ